MFYSRAMKEKSELNEHKSGGMGGTGGLEAPTPPPPAPAPSPPGRKKAGGDRRVKNTISPSPRRELISSSEACGERGGSDQGGKGDGKRKGEKKGEKERREEGKDGRGKRPTGPEIWAGALGDSETKRVTRGYRLEDE